ncbi:MAG TPA: thiamine biosynthesis protein ThiJ [Spirochaeta sp.]|nr:thiamine biosynthesis protein ThiJ [Spirochaeta sp.]
MKKIFGLIYDDMAEFEVILALDVLGYHPSLEVSLIAQTKEVVKSKAGLNFLPDYTIDEALKLSHVEGLIIPGGWSDEQSPELSSLIRKLDEEEAMLAAICRGPSFLARAGVLDDVKYTTTYSEQLVEELKVRDPFDRSNFVDQKVVVDGRFITAIGSAFIDFSVEVLDYFMMFDDENDKENFRNVHKGL